MKKSIRIEGIDCALCAAKLEKAISGLEGVRSAKLNFFLQRLDLEAEEGEMQAVLGRVARLCRKLEPDAKVTL